MTPDPLAADPWAGSPAAAPPPAPTPAPARSRAPVVIAGVAAVVCAGVLVGGLAYLWSRGPVGHQECTEGDLSYDAELARGGFDTWCIHLEPGEAMRFRVTPTDGQDIAVAFAFDDVLFEDPFFGGSTLTDESAADIEAAFFGGLDAPGDDVGRLAGLIDERGPADAESDIFPPLPVPVDLHLLVAGFDGAAGSYTIDVEVLPAPDAFDPDEWETLEDYSEGFLTSDVYAEYYAEFFEGEFFEP